MQANDQIVLKKRPVSRFSGAVLIALLLVSLGVLMAGWSLFWFVAAQQAEALLDAWTKHEKSVDRIWSCPNRQIGGYPFKIEIICDKPGFSGEVLGRQLTGGVKEFHATASLFHPDQVEVLTTPPFELHSNDGEGEISLQWNVMRVFLCGLPQDVEAISIEGSDVSLRGGLKGLGPLAGRAGRLSSRVAIVPERRADDVYSFHLVLDDASFPALDALLGSTPPDVIKFDGAVTKANFNVTGAMAERMEHWRLAGGRLEFQEASVMRGSTKIAARGTLLIDDQHRPQGRLDAEFAGAEPLLKRYGVNPSLVAAGSILNALLGGKSNGNAAPAAGPPSLQLPVTLQSGLITIGPVKTSLAVPPLY
jgi:hypothetical protein